MVDEEHEKEKEEGTNEQRLENDRRTEDSRPDGDAVQRRGRTDTVMETAPTMKMPEQR